MINDHFRQFYEPAKDIFTYYDVDVLHDFYRACLTDFSYVREYKKGNRTVKEFKNMKNSRVYESYCDTISPRDRDVKSGDIDMDFSLHNMPKLTIVRGNDVIIIDASAYKHFHESEFLGETVKFIEKSYWYRCYKNIIPILKNSKIMLKGEDLENGEIPFLLGNIKYLIGGLKAKPDLEIKTRCFDIVNNEDILKRSDYLVFLDELQKLNTLEVYQDGEQIEKLNNLDINYADAFANSMKLCEKYYKDYTKLDYKDPTL